MRVYMPFSSFFISLRVAGAAPSISFAIVNTFAASSLLNPSSLTSRMTSGAIVFKDILEGGVNRVLSLDSLAWLSFSSAGALLGFALLLTGAAVEDDDGAADGFGGCFELIRVFLVVGGGCESEDNSPMLGGAERLRPLVDAAGGGILIISTGLALTLLVLLL